MRVKSNITGVVLLVSILINLNSMPVFAYENESNSYNYNCSGNPCITPY